jgi:hypothetical protein
MIQVPRAELAIAVVALEAVIEFMDRVDYRWPSDDQYEVLKESTASLRGVLGPLPDYQPAEIPAAFRRAFQ